MMQTKHRQTYKALQNQSTEWIKKSAASPNEFMSSFCIKLHYVVLRERGEL